MSSLDNANSILKMSIPSLNILIFDLLPPDLGRRFTGISITWNNNGNTIHLRDIISLFYCFSAMHTVK